MVAHNLTHFIVSDIGYAFTDEEAQALQGQNAKAYASKLASIIGRVYNLTFNYHGFKQSKLAPPLYCHIIIMGNGLRSVGEHST